MMNKKGELVLRDIFFMIVIVGAFFAFISYVVVSMGNEYNNTNMTSEFIASNVSSIGNNILEYANNSGDTMLQATQGSGTESSSDNLLGSFNNIYGVINGAGKILKVVVGFPFYIGNYLSILLEALYIPSALANVVGLTITLLIYGIIIFVIISALLKGGKV